VQDHAHLIGAVGGELSLVQLDQVLGLAASAVGSLVYMLGGSGLETSDDEADIQALGGGLDTGASAALFVPGFCAVGCLGEAAQTGLAVKARRVRMSSAASTTVGVTRLAGPDFMIEVEAVAVVNL
jgi:hypothetical protein